MLLSSSGLLHLEEDRTITVETSAGFSSNFKLLPENCVSCMVQLRSLHLVQSCCCMQIGPKKCVHCTLSTFSECVCVSVSVHVCIRVGAYMCVLRTYITSFALIGARMYVCPCVGSSSVDASDKRQCSNPGTHVRRSVRVCGSQHFESIPVMKDVQTCTYILMYSTYEYVYMLVHMYIVVQCMMYVSDYY